MASAGRKQKPWQSRGKDFELDLFEMASWGVGGLYTEVQDAIPKYCQPLKIRRGVVEDPPRFDTREKTIKYYQNVRDLAAETLEEERAHDKADVQYPYLTIRELGKSYSDKFIADDKEGAMAVAQTVVDAIAVKTKDAMTASQGL